MDYSCNMQKISKELGKPAWKIKGKEKVKRVRKKTRKKVGENQWNKITKELIKKEER